MGTSIRSGAVDSAAVDSAAIGGADTTPLGELDPAIELSAARSLLAAARRQLLETQPHASAPTTADRVDVPILSALLAGDPQVLDALPRDAASIVEARLARRLALGRTAPTAREHVVDADIAVRLHRGLAASPWYRNPDVADGVNLVLDALLGFWRSRAGLPRKYVPYLFNRNAVEEDLAQDLEEFLGRDLGALVATEVRHVHGGRVDVAITFPSYRLFIELKKDSRQIDVASMRSYLLQSASYQVGEPAIGFLAVLDLRPHPSGMPHMTDCFDLIVLNEQALGEPRYVITMVVPGNREDPSSLR